MRSLPIHDCIIIEGGMRMVRSTRGTYIQRFGCSLRKRVPASFTGASMRMKERFPGRSSQFWKATTRGPASRGETTVISASR